MANVIVIGAGAAGMMAAYAASLCGHQVLILEKNEKAGKKIYITGKGRCNLTNASDLETIFASTMENLCIAACILLIIRRSWIFLLQMVWR